MPTPTSAGQRPHQLCRSARPIAGQRRSRAPFRTAAAEARRPSAAEAVAVSKRALLLTGLSGLALLAAAPAQAEPNAAAAAVVGWWKGRQTLNSAKLIAPIKVAQRRLEEAAAMLDSPSSAALALQVREPQGLLNASAAHSPCRRRHLRPRPPHRFNPCPAAAPPPTHSFNPADRARLQP
jgi:hypothetical protein